MREKENMLNNCHNNFEVNNLHLLYSSCLNVCLILVVLLCLVADSGPGQVESGSSSEGNEQTVDADVQVEDMERVTPPTAKRGRKNWITPRLTAALDAAKVSDGKAVHILTAAAEALGANFGELAVNHTSLNELRKKNRQHESEITHEQFLNNVIEFTRT